MFLNVLLFVLYCSIFCHLMSVSFFRSWWYWTVCHPRLQPKFKARIHWYTYILPEPNRYTGWKKCYQATVDDWEPSSFRVKCTYKGPTVTLVRYGNYTLGGYTKLIWKSEYQLLLPLLRLCQVHADTFVTRPKETITCTYLLAISFYATRT